MLTSVFVSSSGECISGALYWKDLVKIASQVGFAPPVIVTAKAISTAGQGSHTLIGKSNMAKKKACLSSCCLHRFTQV